MRASFSNWIYSALIGVSLLGSVQVASAQPTTRDHRHGPTTPPPPPPPPQPVVNTPREAPPPPREEKHDGRKRGFTWQGGHWQWKNGKYDWTAGHWERARAKKKWRDARWEQKGNEWVYVDGGWDDADERPRSAPPAPQEEKFENRPGYTYVKGHWEWEDGRYQWEPGRYERVQNTKMWREGKWEQRGNEWVWVEGAWVDYPRYPNAAPPAYQNEAPQTRPGHSWVRGYYEWKNGAYVWVPGHLEPDRDNKRYVEGRWELKGDHWEWVAPTWQDTPRYPTSAPPPPQVENQPVKVGSIWVRGYHTWKNGQYVWVPGHYEQERTTQQWVEGKWELKGDHWEWTAGHWDNYPKFPTQPPPPLKDESAIRTQIMAKQPPGVTWQPGNYSWERGAYFWHQGLPVTDPKHRYENFVGAWERVGDHYEFKFHWEKVPQTPPPPPPPVNQPPPPPPPVNPPPTNGPTSAPPPPIAENPGTKTGFIWVRGAHKWNAGKYEWTPGHWERARAKQTWEDGRWEQRGNVWVYIEGSWH